MELAGPGVCLCVWRRVGGTGGDCSTLSCSKTRAQTGAMKSRVDADAEKHEENARIDAVYFKAIKDKEKV